MSSRSGSPNRMAELQMRFRGLAIEDGLRDAAVAFAAESGQRRPRPRKSAAQFPFETALREHLIDVERRQDALIEQAPDAWIVCTKDGRILSLNARGEALFGRTWDRLVGETLASVLSGAFVAEVLKEGASAALEAAGSASLTGIDVTGRRADGSEFPAEALAQLIEGGTPILLVSVRDVSLRKAAERHAAEDYDALRDLLDASPDVLIKLSRRGRILYANEQVSALLGYAPAEITGVPATRILPEARLAELRDIGDGDGGRAVHGDARKKDGSTIAVELRLGRYRDPRRGTSLVVMRAQATADSSARVASAPEAVGNVATGASSPASGAHPADRSLAELTLGSLADALVSIDLAGAIQFMNRTAEELTGWSWQRAQGRPLAEVVRAVDAGTQADATKAVAGVAPGTTQLQANVALVREDGRLVPIEGSSAPIEDRDGRRMGHVLLFRDASRVREQAQQIAHSAQHDPLTGLPNRVLLNDRIGNAISIAPRHRKKVGILFLDLDGFKQVNDRLGHATGDRLLRAVAERLMSCVRGSDTVSRIGGDEFVVLLSEVERAEDSAITARRMLEAVSETYRIDNQDLNVSVSIGVSVYPDDGTDAETLINNADAAMYQAKENGRRNYQFYKPAMNLRAIERQDIEDSLRQAIEREELSLHFQPKVNLHTGEIAGAEALLRWDHPKRGSVAPALFMPVAEASGLIQPIGDWVLREACRQTQAWRKAGLVLPMIAINISGAQFAGGRFVDGVFEALSDTGLDPRTLELELNEGALMKQAGQADSILQALHAGGIHMSVDDFGTGYSNLDHLRRFPIHTLKIDQTFVREISAADADARVVTMVLSMARSLNLRVAAEGVETARELEFLQLHHCDEAQGYYFSRPLAAGQFAQLLKEGLMPTMAARRMRQSFGRLRGHALPPSA